MHIWESYRIIHKILRELFDIIDNQEIKSSRLQDIVYQIKNGKENIRICKYCGNKFKPTSNSEFYCSDVCRIYYKHTKKNSNTLISKRECGICKKTFIPRFKTQIFCCAECAILGERQKGLYYDMYEKIFQSEAKKIKKYRLSGKFKGKEIYVKEIILKCEYCGIRFNSKTIIPKYCSSECLEKQEQEIEIKVQKQEKVLLTDDALKLKKLCKYCGKNFLEEPGSDSAFCSLKCRNSFAKGKPSKEKNNQLKEVIRIKVANLIEKSREPISEFNGRDINYWEITFPSHIRDKTLERDDYTCQICTSGHNLHVHHIRPRIRGGAHIEDNLITLCGKCHRHIETRDIDHATNKCYRNYINVIRNEEIRPIKINKDELINQLRDNLEYVLERLSSLDNDETKELAKEIDNFLDENYKF